MSAPGTERSFDELEGERDFLLRSLRDLERERAAGDVSEEDYESLRASYTERAARAIREVDARAARDDGSDVGESAAAVPIRRRVRRFLGRPRTRRVLAITGGALVVVGIGLAAASFAGVRLPGQSATGSVTVPQSTKVAEQLVEASEFANAGEIASAISLYAVVLNEVPHQAEALTYRGWLERLAGIRAHSSTTLSAGDASMAEAVHVAPGYADARALHGIALADDDHDDAAALAQFRAFVSDKPSASLLAEVAPQLLAIYQHAGVAPPEALVHAAAPNT